MKKGLGLGGKQKPLELKGAPVFRITRAAAFTSIRNYPVVSQNVQKFDEVWDANILQEKNTMKVKTAVAFRVHLEKRE